MTWKPEKYRSWPRRSNARRPGAAGPRRAGADLRHPIEQPDRGARLRGAGESGLGDVGDVVGVRNAAVRGRRQHRRPQPLLLAMQEAAAWAARAITSAAVPLKWLSIIVGFVAAVLWWVSASVPPPSPGAAIGGTEPSDPFNVALRDSAHLNQWAAIATGASVFLMSLAEAGELFARRAKR